MKGELVYRHFFSMGTRFDLVLPGVDEEQADNLLHAIQSELSRIEDKISIYRDNSAFSLINKEAFNGGVFAEPEVFALVDELVSMSEKTFGYFDFTLGKISQYKHTTELTRKAPMTEGPDSLSNGFNQLTLDRDSRQIHFLSEEVSLDSGGFGKGYGLDQVRTLLITGKCNSAFISFGESAILGFGKHPYGDSWKTGVCHVFNASESVWEFGLRDEVLSVSGNSLQNMKKYGRGHIINPKTKEPVEGFSQVAVAGKRGLIAEVISTAMFCAPAEVREQIAKNFPQYRIVIVDYDHHHKPHIVFTSNC
jgi:FAD:protein FMN transferase